MGQPSARPQMGQPKRTRLLFTSINIYSGGVILLLLFHPGGLRMRNFSFESIYIYYEREEIVPSHSVLEAEQEKGGARNLPEKWIKQWTVKQGQ